MDVPQTVSNFTSSSLTGESWNFTKLLTATPFSNTDLSRSIMSFSYLNDDVLTMTLPVPSDGFKVV